MRKERLQQNERGSIRVEWHSYYVFGQEDDQNGFFKEPHRVNADDQQYWYVAVMLSAIDNY